MAGKTFEVTADNFESEVLTASQPVLVDFWATWCAPCRAIAPVVEQIAEEYNGKLRVGKLDADAHMAVLERYGVMSIPTLILFKGGQPVARITGNHPKDKLLSQIKPHLA